MRTFLRGKITLLFMTFGLLLAIPAIALADNIQNDVDATTEGKIVSVQAGQKSEDVGYRIGASGGDPGDSGSANCNPARSPVSITINTPTGVTVENTSGTALTAPQLTFNSCGTFQFVKFAVASSVTPGDYNVTVADAGTSYNESPASFTLRVTAPSDTTAPTDASLSIDNAALWTNNASGNVSLALSASDDTGVTSYRLAETQAGLATATAVSVSPAEKSFSRSNVSFTLTGSEGEFKTVWLRVCDAQNNCSDASDTIGWDKTAPTITNLGPTTDPNGADWYNTDVTNRFKASDSLSGLNSACVTNFPLSAGDNVQSKTTSGEGTAVKVTSDSCTDVAGNSATGIDSATFQIDKSAPTNVAFVGGPAAGGSYDPDSVPLEPTCTANGDISGLASCLVTGYSANAGSHTMTATATDNASNVATAQRSYEVKGWTLKGFYQPVDMTITNTAKAGQTVPLKFEMFEQVSGDERTNPADVKTFTQKVTCGTFTPTEDAIEEYSSGSTSLRYDTTGGQFIFNYQTPKSAGSCFKVTLTPNDTSSNSIVANFKLK